MNPFVFRHVPWVFYAVLLQSSAGLPWGNGALTQKRWKVKVRVLIKWGIKKNPPAPLLLQKTDMNLFRLNSKTLATLCFGTLNCFLLGWYGQKFGVQYMLLCPNGPFNQFKPVQQRWLQVLRTYCPNLYTVISGNKALSKNIFDSFRSDISIA